MSLTSLDRGACLQAISSYESPASRLLRKTVVRLRLESSLEHAGKKRKTLPDPFRDKISARRRQRGGACAHNSAGKSHWRARSVRVISAEAGHPVAGASPQGGVKSRSRAHQSCSCLALLIDHPDDKPLRAGALTKKNDKEHEGRLAERLGSEGIVKPSASLPRHPVRLRAAALPDVVLGR